MANIVQKGNKVLSQTAKEIPLEEITSAKIKNLIKKMRETLLGIEDGVALAAPQVGVSLKLFIALDEFLKPGFKPPQEEAEKAEKKKANAKISVFINPKIIKRSAKKKLMHEGCLSVAGVFGHIERSEKVTIESYDENGKKFTRGAGGLAAQIFQHEVDHLEGKLFVDKAKRLDK